MNNIISEYINFSKQCINRYFKKILANQYQQEIVNKLVNNYIDSRYYSSSDNLSLLIRNNLNKASSEFTGADKELADNVVKTFNFILYFDNVIECESTVKVIEALANFRENVLKIAKESSFEEEFLEMLKTDLIKKKEYIDSFDAKKFDFECSLTTHDRLYDVTVNQNLKFPNVYNSAVIDKVFKSKDLADKRTVLEYKFTSLQVLKDLIKGVTYEYLVTYPSGISTKEGELEKLFAILDNEVLIERVSIKINFDDFINEKEVIYEYMRKGYKFAVILKNNFVEDETNTRLLTVFKYIIINRRNSFIEVNNYKNTIKVE